jgi:hypothetical protein
VTGGRRARGLGRSWANAGAGPFGELVAFELGEGGDDGDVSNTPLIFQGSRARRGKDPTTAAPAAPPTITLRNPYRVTTEVCARGVASPLRRSAGMRARRPPGLGQTGLGNVRMRNSPNSAACSRRGAARGVLRRPGAEDQARLLANSARLLTERMGARAPRRPEAGPRPGEGSHGTRAHAHAPVAGNQPASRGVSNQGVVPHGTLQPGTPYRVHHLAFTEGRQWLARPADMARAGELGPALRTHLRRLLDLICTTPSNP